MAEIKSNYKNILEEENKILSEVLDLQTGLKSAVNGKDWTELMHVVSEINLNMDKLFQYNYFLMELDKPA